MATFLPFVNDSGSSGSKFVINCNSINRESPTTKEWLDTLGALQIIDKTKALKMSDKKILEGLFHKKTRVVVKIAASTENLEIEWTTYSTLQKHKIGGIVKYFCYFTCADSLKKYAADVLHPSLCEGPATNGETLQVLVMEHINSRSFKTFDWSSVSIDVFRSCAKQVVCTMVEAYKKCGFTHGDLHLDNILIQQTTKSKVHSYQIKLMDFEFSSFIKTKQQFLIDIKLFVKRLVELIDFVYVSQIEKMNEILNKWINNFDASPIEPERLLELLPLIDKIEAKSNAKVYSGGEKRAKWPSLEKGQR